MAPRHDRVERVDVLLLRDPNVDRSLLERLRVHERSERSSNLGPLAEWDDPKSAESGVAGRRRLTVEDAEDAFEVAERVVPRERRSRAPAVDPESSAEN